jgi:hypothetical protein
MAKKNCRYLFEFQQQTGQMADGTKEESVQLSKILKKEKRRRLVDVSTEAALAISNKNSVGPNFIKSPLCRTTNRKRATC